MMRALTSILVVGFLAAGGVTRAFAQHTGHQHEPAKPTAPEQAQPPAERPPFVPPVTDEDRKAAFPDVDGHAIHDQAINYFVLFDQLEWRAAGGGGVDLDSKGWIGRDRDRLWFRAEADGDTSDVEEAEAHVLYGRQFSRWWDVVVGVRQDFRPGPSRTWAAVGVQGLAPYWFEVEGTAYIGAEGRTHFRGEVEYELLLTNRLVLQPLLEVEIYGKSDPERGIGAGLSSTDVGLRVRYELRREFAPYVGFTWTNRFFGTADFAEAAGEDTHRAGFVAGARLWF